MTSTSLEFEERPLAEALSPLLEEARNERADLQNQARALRNKAEEAETALRAREHDLAFLDSLIMELASDNKRVPEYKRLRETHVEGSGRLQQQSKERRAAATAFDERLLAIDREIELLELGQSKLFQTGRN